jgi:membrane-bound serine protease (ClpP class)
VEVLVPLSGLDLSAIDPDIIYLVLVVGLWATITAVYVSGTLILEGLAFLGLAFGLLALAAMPTNWLAVLLLMVGTALFLVTPFLQRHNIWLSAAGVTVQALAGLFLFREGVSVSPVIILLTLAIPFAYNQVVLVPLLDTISRQPSANRDDRLIGQRGRVAKTLDPVGTVQVNGELWTAVLEDSDDGPRELESGEPIVVVDRAGLQLIVEGIKRKRQSHENGYHQDAGEAKSANG